MKPVVITVQLNQLVFGVKPEYEGWWNWDKMDATWRILDEKPDTPLEELPLFRDKIIVYHALGKGGKRWSRLRLLGNTGVHRDIYFDIRDNGFDSKREPLIRVRTNKDGVIHVGNGHHRVSMLKHLGYKEVEVRMSYRHPSFLKFKRDLFNLYGEKFLYQPVDHPVFADWEVNFNGCHEVLQFISSNLDVVGKRVLDIGSCTGWFSYRLAKLGARMTGVDTHVERVELAEYQRIYRGAEPDNPLFLNESFEKHLQGDIRYDVVLLLNVIHHYIRKDVNHSLKMLNQISQHTNILVVQLSTKIPITIDKLIDRVKKETRFTKCQIHVLPEHEDRPVLLFKRKHNDYTM